MSDDLLGWTSVASATTALAIVGDTRLAREVRAHLAAGLSAEALRDWAIREVIGTHNRRAIDGARARNTVPKEQRTDERFEALRAEDPQAAEWLIARGLGPDVDDIAPSLIDAETVDWDQVLEYLNRLYAP